MEQAQELLKLYGEIEKHLEYLEDNKISEEDEVNNE